jgi:hypothetical protein
MKVITTFMSAEKAQKNNNPPMMMPFGGRH